uniref:ethanolamine-phosphate cytidylyltransferase n=1 Tax=Aegilops tauschii TaxID=37682 RepID=M8BTF5_AEGTA
MVRAVKWVDDVIPDAPYAITEDFMNKLFNEYNIDYIIHGDDPCLLPDGTDAYALAKKAGRYKQIKRTEGVSTTDIVGRMLLCVRERPVSDNQSHSSLQRQFSHGHGQNIDDSGFGNGTKISHFLPTSRRIVQFSNGRGPGPDSRVVYIDGAFDLFHAGHVECIYGFFNVDIATCSRAWRFLACGHSHRSDHKHFFSHSCLIFLSSTRGPHRPIMNLHERSLSVLACRYVDEVIIGAPWHISKDMDRLVITCCNFSCQPGYVCVITTFNISLVVHGTIAENMDYTEDDSNPYAAPIAMGIYHKLDSPLDITTSTIIRRIVSNHEAYQKRNEKKEASEKKYYDSKSFVNGE